VKDHTVIPHIRVAQSNSQINLQEVELRLFSTDNSSATGLFALPQGKLLVPQLEATQNGIILRDDPLRGEVKWQIKRIEIR
jgi:hypothetical protein